MTIDGEEEEEEEDEEEEEEEFCCQDGKLLQNWKAWQENMTAKVIDNGQSYLITLRQQKGRKNSEKNHRRNKCHVVRTTMTQKKYGLQLYKRLLLAPIPSRW